MTSMKPWYASKTIWSSLVAGAAAILSVFGYDIDPQSQMELASAALQMVTIAASLFAVIGRLTATSAIE